MHRGSDQGMVPGVFGAGSPHGRSWRCRRLQGASPSDHRRVRPGADRQMSTPQDPIRHRQAPRRLGIDGGGDVLPILARTLCSTNAIDSPRLSPDRVQQGGRRLNIAGPSPEVPRNSGLLRGLSRTGRLRSWLARRILPVPSESNGRWRQPPKRCGVLSPTSHAWAIGRRRRRALNGSETRRGQPQVLASRGPTRWAPRDGSRTVW